MFLRGDALATLRELPAASVNCCITSPPYWGLRDYGTGTWEGGSPDCEHTTLRGAVETAEGGQRHAASRDRVKPWCRLCGARRADQQFGLEATPEEYVARLVEIFGEVHRVLREDGTLWLNLGDSYCPAGGDRKIGDSNGPNTCVGPSANAAMPKNGRVEQRRSLIAHGIKPKDLVGIPWRVAFALQAYGWWLRSDIIWAKPAPMPESITDRCTRSHEYIFMLAKSERYYFDANAIAEPTSGLTGRDVRNRRDVWTVNTEPFPGAHFATFPRDLILPCVLAGCPAGGTVLDPFSGAGTTALVAKENGRNWIGIELNPEYIAMSEKRLAQEVLFQ